MRIQINGEVHTVALGETLESLVLSLGLPSDGVALALNRQVVSRREWASRSLTEGDRVEIVRAVGGG